jgi:hypothetical protein
MSESKESGSVRGIRNAYIFTAIAISCIMVGASLGMVINASTPGIPTVIEPGSMVFEWYYTVFADGSSIYARNGTTGTVDYTGSSASTVMNWAIQNTPPGRTVGIVGDFNFSRPVLLNKNVNLVFDGNMTAYHTDFLIIGDETHFVTGANIWLDSVNGLDLWTNTSCLRFMQSISVNVYFNDIMLFDRGIYFDPVGIGSGENSFFGGRVIACTDGVSWNTTWPHGSNQFGIWSQGNRFYMSIYSCDRYGFYASGPAACDMNVYVGTIDCAYGLLGNLNIPGWHGGGKDIQDDWGGQKFFLVFVGTVTGQPDQLNYFVSSGTLLMTQYGTLIPQLNYKWGPDNVPLSLNGVLGNWTNIYYPVVNVPRLVEFNLTGLASGEQITIEVSMQIGATSTVEFGDPLWLNFTSNGTTTLTETQLFSLVNFGYSTLQIFIRAYTNEASTNAVLSVIVLV